MPQVMPIMDVDSEERGMTLAELNAVGVRADGPPMDFDEWSEGM